VQENERGADSEGEDEPPRNLVEGSVDVFKSVVAETGGLLEYVEGGVGIELT